MPIGGSYRSIDFALSNMSNSHVQTVAVLTQYSARSLNEHLNSSKWWDFGRKQGGLYVFTPTITDDNGYWYRGTADAIYQNLDFLRKCHEPYVIITSGDAVYKMDYNKVLEYHIAKKADITPVSSHFITINLLYIPVTNQDICYKIMPFLFCTLLYQIDQQSSANHINPG